MNYNVPFNCSYDVLNGALKLFTETSAWLFVFNLLPWRLRR